MKQHILSQGILAVVGLSLIACQNKEIDFSTPQRDGPVFYASMEQVAEPDTRVYADENLMVLWHADDRVGIFNKYTYNQQYRFDGETGANSGTFSKVPSETFVTGNAVPAIYAVYPYAESTTITNDCKIQLTLPAEQAYSTLNFGPGANTMVSATEDNNLLFKNLGGYLAVKLYGDNVTVSKVTLRGNKSEKLAGHATVTAPLDGDPTVVMAEDATEEITVNCAEPVTIGTSAENYTEFWFVLPPTTFEEGFTITVTDQYGGIFVKSTSKPVEINRNHLSRMSPIEVLPDYTNQLAIERNVLIELYHALNGDDWDIHTNWLSDRPVGEWRGVVTNEQGFVIKLNLRQPYNPMDGYIPKEIGMLSHLVSIHFWLRTNEGIPAEIGNLKELTDFTLYVSNREKRYEFPEALYNCTKLTRIYLTGAGLTGVLSPKIGQLQNLQELSIGTNYITGPLPDEIGNLSSLKTLDISGSGKIGAIPHTIGNLKNLKQLFLNHISGDIPKELGDLAALETLWLYSEYPVLSVPDEICNLTNLKNLELNFTQLPSSIPEEIGNLTELEKFIMGYDLKGEIPESIGNLKKLKYLCFTNPFPGVEESLRGNVPQSLQHLDNWPYFWADVIFGHPGLGTNGLYLPAPRITAKDLAGNTIDTDVIYPSKRLTIIYTWDEICPEVPSLHAVLKEAYRKYADAGLEIIGYNSFPEDYLESLVDSFDLPWRNYSTNRYPFANGQSMAPGNIMGLALAVDSSGQVVYETLTKSVDGLQSFIEKVFAQESSDYVSTDFSQDGIVTQMQAASSGRGINLILVGDGFSDRQIADGTYQNRMDRLKEAFFSEGPYKSLQHLFNVYSVTAVSKTEGYDETGLTAIGGWFGDGTHVGGRDGNAISYALKAIDMQLMDDATIIVVMNKDAYAGTCYMYNPDSGDYGRGLSIAYFPASSDTDTFNGLVFHEAGGHGFAKLADEYAYSSMGTIPQAEIDAARRKEAFGWFKNIDFTDDPSRVKWSRFIDDERYSSENIGCYEGGFTYWNGIWRPTENSIMNTNTGGFNAPSRYAIWYRINKLAYGESWNGTYEDFVEYDAINRTTAANSRRRAKNYVEKPLPPLAPPVIVGHSWRDEMK